MNCHKERKEHKEKAVGLGRREKTWHGSEPTKLVVPLCVSLRSLRPTSEFGFNLTTTASIYADTLQQAEQPHWGYRKFLQHLCESEAEARRQRRIARRLKHSGLPDGKSLGNLDEALLPEKIRRQLPTLLEGGFVERGENVLAFGLPGRGKSHFVAALGRELILRHGHTVLFIPTFKLVQKLLLAKKALKLEALLRKLDRYAVVALDDIGYVQQDREEMEVLFTFLAERYERRSVMITSNRASVISCWSGKSHQF